MGFRNGAYAKVWEVKNGTGNYTDVRLSTSKKSKQSGEYEQDFSGYVRFIGQAHEDASKLKEGDRIKLGECEVTNSYKKENRTTYTNYAVFSFERTDGNVTTSKPSKTDEFMSIPDGVEDDGLPFN